jgi:hypothetical protein
MKTRALLLALPILALTACADNRTTLSIQGACAPTKDCTFSGRCDAFALGSPVLDPGAFGTAAPFLTLILQVENQLADNSSSDLNRNNTNGAHVDEAVVEYSGLISGKAVFGASGDIQANSTTVLWVDVIPGVIGSTIPSTGLPVWPLYGEIQAKLRLRGYLDDNTRFETGEYPVTIQVSDTLTSTVGGSGVATCAGACPHAGQWPAACP